MARIQGVTIGIDADASNFNKSLKKMNTGIRGTQQEVYNLTKSLEFKWDAAKFTRAQKLAQQALNDTNEKAKVLRERLQYLDQQGTDKTTQEYRKLEQQLASTERQALQMEAKLTEINKLPIENLTKKFDAVGQSITKAGEALVPVSAAAAALLAGFAKVGIDAIALGDDIGTTAQQLNIATEELQKWRYIAEQTDVDNAKLEMGFRKIQAGLGALAVGDTTDPIAIALEELGFTAEQASLGMEENFDKVINSLANMKDATEQAYLANEIFGTRVGALIIPLLNEGGEALAELGAEFESFTSLTDEQVQALDAYEDEWQRVVFQFKAIAAQIGASLLPTFKQLSGFLEKSILPIVTKISEAFTGLTTAQKNSILSILTFTAALAPTLLIVGKLTSATGSLVKGVYAVRGALTLLAAHPIVLVIFGLIALMAVLYKRNEEFRNSLNELVTTLGSALKPILGVLGEILQSVGGYIGSMAGMMSTILVPVLLLVLNILKPIIELLGKGLPISLKILSTPLRLLAQGLSFVADIISDKLTKGITYFQAGIKEFFGILPTLFNTGIKYFENFVNTVIKGINVLIDKVNSVSGIFGKTFEKVNEVDIKFNYDDVEEGIGAVTSAVGGFLGGDTTTSAPTVTQDDILPANILTDITPTTAVDTVNNYDSSTKNVTIEVTIENYGDEIDTDALINEINVKLAGAL